MMAAVYDEPTEEGITLVFEEDEVSLQIVEGAPMFGVYMNDEQAEELIDIMQNKLNARRP